MRTLHPMTPIVTSVVILLAASNAAAQWTRNGVAACTNSAEQWVLQNQSFAPDAATRIVSDGSGGVIVVFSDVKSSLHDLFAQRIDAAGIARWGINGAVVSGAPSHQLNPAVIADGAGGIIATWHDQRAGGTLQVYAQRINSLGIAQWTTDGVLVSASPLVFDAKLVADGAGGAIITWADYRSNANIYAQRINGSGVPQWTVDGVLLCNNVSAQDSPRIVPDGAGGAIVAFADVRSGTGDLYAQRVNAAGAPQWSLDGVPICAAATDQSIFSIIADGAGGAIVAWQDPRSGNADIYAQRINGSGVVQWTANGVALCVAPDGQGWVGYGSLASDGAGGAIATWHDFRNSAEHNIFVQRVNPSGVPVWGHNGVPVCMAATDQGFPSIAPDGDGGAVIAWHDSRNGPATDIYAQRITSNGNVEWTTDGVLVATADNGQAFPQIIPDQSGGVIMAWNDARWGNTDVYVQRIDNRHGYWGHSEPVLASVADVPSDQGGKVSVNWHASGREDVNEEAIGYYTIWRATDETAVASAAVVALSDVGAGFTGPAFRRERMGAVDYFWELVGTQDAISRPAYSFSASTKFDFTISDPAVHHFQVVAHAAANPYLNWPSNTVSGSSVDNLAPAAPLSLVAQRAGANVNLRWNRAAAPDLRDYAIYRATSAGVTPVPIHYLASAEDTVAVDSGAPASTLYYIVTAFDVHENQSAPSNEAVVGPATSVGNLPAITGLTILQNYPNPFTVSTDLRIGLPAASDLAVELYDVAGRRVRSLSVRGLNAGWQKLTLPSLDDVGRPLASGVYFYRVTAGGETATRKMVIAR